MSKRKTIEEVKCYIEIESNSGYKLLSTEYNNAKEKLILQCDKGHIYDATYSDFKQHKRCSECKKINISKKLSYSYEFVKDFIESYDYQLLSKEYKNNKSKIILLCPNNHVWETNFDTFKNQGCRCLYCSIESRNNSMRYDDKFVNFRIEQYNYKWIDGIYYNYDSSLTLECPEGHIYNTTFNNFDSGHRCKKCDGIKRSGENCHLWKGGITSEIKMIRCSTEYKEWRNKVFKRDNYTCQCCGNYGGKLNVHHIKNFSSNEKLRFDVDNGITLCEDCHSIHIKHSFHNIYTQFNNTPEQLEEYIQRYKNGEFDELRNLNNNNIES